MVDPLRPLPLFGSEIGLDNSDNLRIAGTKIITNHLGTERTFEIDSSGQLKINGTGITPSDSRKIASFSVGGVAGKRVVWIGDSTTYNMSNQSGAGVVYSGIPTAVPTPQSLTSAIAQTVHLNRGQNGQTLQVFMQNLTLMVSGTTAGTGQQVMQAVDSADTGATNYGTSANNGYYDTSITKIIAERYDLAVISYGINDTRGVYGMVSPASSANFGPSATGTITLPDYRASSAGALGASVITANIAAAAALLATSLKWVAQRLTTGNSNICIVMRMPNPGVTGGSGYVAVPSFPVGTTNAAPTAQDAWNVMSAAYRLLNTASYTLSNMVVWDSASLFPNQAVGSAGTSNNALIGNDSSVGLHPYSPAGYVGVEAAIGQLISPLSTANALLSTQQVFANNKELALGANWNVALSDLNFYLDSDDWYVAYNVVVGASGSNFFYLASADSSASAGTLQMGGVTATGHGYAVDAAPGLVQGDVVVFPGVPYAVRVINVPSIIAGPNLSWNPSSTSSGAGNNINYIDDSNYISNNFGLFTAQPGIVYRHKSAYSPVARAILAANAASRYQAVLTGQVYRCQVAYNGVWGYIAGNGYVVVQSVPNEYAANGKTLVYGSHTVLTTDILSIPGVDLGSPYSLVTLGSATLSTPPTGALTAQAITTSNASSNIACTGHGYSVGQAVVFGGTVASGSIFANGLYFVKTVTDVNNFTVCTGNGAPGGTALTFTGAGTSPTVMACPNSTTIQLSGQDFSKFVVPQGLIFSAT